MNTFKIGSFYFDLRQITPVTDENRKATLAYLFKASHLGRVVNGSQTPIDIELDKILTENADSENPIYNLDNVKLTDSAYRLVNRHPLYLYTEA